MDRLVTISEWKKAVQAVGADEVAGGFGYRHGRRLPAENSIFTPLRRLLRDRSGWHGTAVQLQKELEDERHCTVW